MTYDLPQGIGAAGVAAAPTAPVYAASPFYYSGLSTPRY
jgi:hypothetical protein